MTAFRLPDQFSPNALGATAATPTCCCCCCCCLASTLTTSIVLHGGLGRDLARVAEPERPKRHERARAYTLLIWFAVLVLPLPIAISTNTRAGGVLAVVAACVLVAAAAVGLIASWAGSPRPAMAAVRLVICAVAFVGEFVGGAYLILNDHGYLLVGMVAAVVSVAVAMKVYGP